MNSPLRRILHLEDNATDAELIQATLEGEGVQVELTRVEAKDEFVDALKQGLFDVILADYTLASFDGLSALRIAKQHARDVPFIFVSGTSGEDIAIEALKTGAADYVLKTRPARLGPAVKRALREAQEKTGRRCAEEASRDSEEQWKTAFERNPVMYFMVDRAGTILSVNNCGADQLGCEGNELVGQPVLNIFHKDDRDLVQKNFENCFHNLGRTMRWEARKVRKDGTVIWVRETANAILLRSRPVLLVVCEDITDRKRAEALLAGEKRILEMLAKGHSLSQILDSLCQLVEEQTAGVLAAIFLVVDGNRLRHGSAPSIPRTYTDAIDDAVIGPRAGSCGPATYRQQAIIRDIAADPLWAAYREAALLHSRHDAWSMPIFSSQGKVIATIAMYYREPRSPSLRDQQIIKQITNLAGIAIQRKLTEDKLSESERVLAEAQRLSHTSSFVLEMATKEALYLSDEWYCIFGFDRETDDHVWEARLERIHPEDLNKWQATVDRAISEKRYYELEYRLVLPTGTTKYVHDMGRPVLNSAGDVVQFIGSVTDITKRKRGEEALRRSEAYLAEAQGLTHTGSYAYSTGGEIYWSEENFRIWGFDPQQRPPDFETMLRRIHSNDRDKVREFFHKAAAARETTDIALEFKLVLPDGKVKHIHMLAHPVLTESGELVEVVGTHVDVTERKRAEEALRTSEQLARSHVEVMMRTVDVLATEAAPKKFIGEMLRTIGHCLHAGSVMLWLDDQRDDSLCLRVAIEDGQQVVPDPGHPLVKDRQGWKTNVLIREMLFTRAPVVCDDIENDSRICVELRQYLMSRACKKFLILPMLVLGEVRGFIGIQHTEREAYRHEEIELAQALAHHVMIAAHGAELAEQQRHAAVLEERTRMARDIHDTLAQGFTGVIVQLDAAVEALRDEEPEEAAKHIRRARELAGESLGEARRSVHALRSEVLERASFCEALRSSIEKVTVGTSLRSEFQMEGEACELAPEVEKNLLRIGQEALTNALKHTHASEFRAKLSFEAEAVRLELCDNGDGFVVNDASGAGFGLIGMRERIKRIGGTLTITSEPGAGTTIIAVSPYQQKA
jgi:PAS domain S-box-containing protein